MSRAHNPGGKVARMEIRDLRYILAIAKYGSLNRAAQALYISQSSLSRILKDMEAEIQTVIFRRSHTGVEPTHDGSAFLSRIGALVDQFERIETDYCEEKHLPVITLTIAAQRYGYSVQALLECYRRYSAEYEFINFAYEEQPADQVIELVGTHAYDLGLIHFTEDSAKKFKASVASYGLVAELLTVSPVHVHVNSTHPLAGKEKIYYSDLIPYAHVTFSDEDITSINYCSDVAQYNGKQSRKRIVVHDRGTLNQLIANTDAYYIGCDLSRLHSVLSGVVTSVPFAETALNIMTYYIHRTDHPLSETEQRFIEILKSIL